MAEEKAETKEVETPSEKTATKAEIKKPKKRSCFWIVLAIVIVIIFWTTIINAFIPFVSYKYLGQRSNDKSLPESEEITNTEEITPENSNSQKTTSTNKNNTKDSTTTDSSTANPTETTYSFLDFYIDIANTTISGEDQPTIRWNKPKVYIGAVPGTLDETYTTCLNWFISDFNANSNQVKMENNAELAEVRIYFMTKQEMINQFDTKLPFASTHPGDNGEIISSKIFMPSDTDWLNDEKCWSLKHEIIHAIGFRGHSNKINNSEMSFNPLYITYAGLSSNDQRAIRMLYSSGIPLLTNQQQVRDYFANHSY